MHEAAHAHGRYHFELFEFEGGPLIREWDQDNIVCTGGKNLMLDTFLSGSAYTVTGPFLGLISNVSFAAVSANDTMLSHTGWLEAGSANAPTYTAPRKTTGWSSAADGSKATNTTMAFIFTGTGTVRGAFLVLGPGAVSTIGNTGGTLYSAGTFSSSQAVVSGNVLVVTYSTGL